MHSTMFTAALLLASTAFAVPLKRNNGTATATTSSYSNSDSEVRVILQNQGIELGTQTPFTGLSREQKRPIGGSGPFKTIEINVGAGNPNQDLRCQALDEAGKPLIAVRGANTDITFADGGNGPWTFQNTEGVSISQVICDPAFEKIGADAFEVRVVLQNQGSELGTQTAFDSVVERQESKPVGSSGPFETVELRVGELAQQDLRCAVLDKAGKKITVLRNGNRDTTFADGDAGLWTFEDGETEVSKIVCDPEFKKASA